MTMTTKTRDPEVQEWDEEWLVRRGNYTTVITPELAEQLLERNTNNRPKKERAISQYARDMQAGKWDPDASDVKFARTGELIDGQNRLLACMRAGVPFPTLVRTGLSIKAKAHVDTGVKRTAADMLRMNGVAGQPTTVGAAVTLWSRYEDRVKNWGGRRLTNRSGGGSGSWVLMLTHEEILDFLMEHPTVEMFANHAEAVRRQVMPAFAPSAILTFLAMAGEKAEDEAYQFVDRLISGEFGGIGDPMMALVQYAAVIRGNTGTGSPGHRGRVAQESQVQAMSRVWNATRRGEKIDGRLHIKITDRLVMPE